MKSADELRSIRYQAYEAGALDRADGSKQDIFPHTLHPDDCDYLRDRIAELKPARTLEIGCATGLSTLALFEGCQIAKTTPEHTIIDPYLRAGWGSASLVLLERTGLTGHITLDERESVVALAEYVGRTPKPSFDFAFIDGCHWFECALTDLWLTSRLVSPGGVIAIDDLWMPAIQRALEYATGNLGVEIIDTRSRGGKDRIAFLRVASDASKRDWQFFKDFE
ncbi:MAG: class I SAM-dependent methyltransferase [Phycisphaerales bacterium]|nr:class I SAM-dependent methyltransferase [Phycisphaerales bacterium]MCB9837336.1 class I SAM-dependent methyltransferase [Phycisphaera sp.]